MIRLTRPYQLISGFLKKLSDDDIASYAASATLFIVISFFPFVMFLLSLINYLPVTQEDFFSFFNQLFPKMVTDYTNTIFRDITQSTSGTVITTTVIAFLWSGSKGFLSIEYGLNAVYCRETKRNYFLRKFLSLVYTLVFAMAILLMLIFIVFGNQIYTRIILAYPRVENFAFFVKSIRTIVGFAFMVFLFASMYNFIPNRKDQRTSFITELPGALFAAAGWIGFSYLYSFYINNIGRFSSIYGNLTAIVLCLLWLYFCMYILFLGAEINDLLKLHEIRSSLHERRRSKKDAKKS